MCKSITGALAAFAWLIVLFSTRQVCAAPTPVISTGYDTSGMAPFTLHVHGLNTAFTAGDRLSALFEWDFGDPGSPYNKIIGTNVAHTYDDAGTYTLRLTVTDQNGSKVSTTKTVNVAADTRQGIYVAANGNDNNPGTQNAPIRTIAKATQLMGANKKFLFRRSDTFDFSSSFEINQVNVLVGSYGSGAKPVFRWTAGPNGYPKLIRLSDQSNAVVIQDLNLTASSPPNTSGPRGIQPAGNNVTVRRCQFSNVRDAMNAEATVRGWYTLQNTSAILTGYFVWGQGVDHTHIANTAAGSEYEHVMRMGDVNRVYIGYSDLTNTDKSTIWLMLGSDAYIAHNTLHTGRMIIGPNFATGSASERYPRAVVEGNTLLETQVIIYPGAEHLVFRNNVIDSQSLEAFSIWGWLAAMNRTVDDVRLYNNTALNGHDLYGRFVKIADGATHITAINNLYVAPHLNTQWGAANALAEDNTLDTHWFTSNLWSRPHTGTPVHYLNTSSGYTIAQWNALPQVGTEQYRTFNFADLAANFAPTFNANTGVPIAGVFTDFNEALRPTSNWTVGAVELNPAGGDDPSAPGDANGDGLINVNDLLAVITAWGACLGGCPADVTDNGVVNVDDLIAVISNWGN